MLSDIPGNWKISKSDGVKEHETSVSKTGNNYWPLGNVATVEESIVNGIDEKRLIMNNGIVQVFFFPGLKLEIWVNLSSQSSRKTPSSLS